jgi:hypothetical protein
MGEIVFENDPPYKRLDAQSAEAIPTSDGVELALNVFVEGAEYETVPIRILLRPEVARVLASQMGPAASAAQRWIDHRR